MLILARRIDEKILIGPDIEVMVVGVEHRGGNVVVRLGVTAPSDVEVDREEVRASRLASALCRPSKDGAAALADMAKPDKFEQE